MPVRCRFFKPELPKKGGRFFTLDCDSEVALRTYDRLRNFVFKKGGNDAYGISDPSGTCLAKVAMALQAPSFKLQLSYVFTRSLTLDLPYYN